MRNVAWNKLSKVPHSYEVGNDVFVAIGKKDIH